MVDLTVTAASVVRGSNAVVERNYDAGETITAGQAVYFDSSTSKWMKADANGSSALARTPRGIALNGASSGQPLAVQTAGDITIGATLTGGTEYYLSDTAGGICPLADVGTGEYFATIGIAKSATVLGLGFNYSGVSA